MPESLQKILAEAKAGKFSSISGLSEDDVANVWENVSTYIEKQMSSQKGVQIPNFGTFSFSQKKMDVGNNKYILMQRPVFNISEKFAQTHGLQFTKYMVPGHIPSPQLNFAAMAFESPFDRDTVESCVREIIGSVSRAVAAKRNVELSFAGIGRLQIRDCRVKMRFYKEFINQMDGSGDLLNSMQNRAGTVDSVMSNRPFSRPGTSNTLILPRINPAPGGASGSGNPLPPLAETDENQNYSSPPPPPVPSSPPEPIVETSINPDIVQYVPDRPDEPEGPVLQEEMERHIKSDAIRIDAFEEPGVGDCATETAIDNMLRDAELREEPVDVYMPKAVMDEIHAERKASPAGRGMSRMAVPMAQATGVSLMDEFVPGNNANNSGVKLSPIPPPEPKAVGFADAMPGGGLEHKPLTPPRLAPLQRSMSAENMVGEKPASKPPTPASACGHPRAGQELCYLCHQRARRNIPVSFTEERKKREEEEERLLQQYQTMRDAEDILREQERHISRRHDLQKISAFNLGVSEAVNAKKRAKDFEPQRSYIFQRRPLTPPRLPKQEQYLRELTTQVESKNGAIARTKADEEFLERLEQVQLAEDLAAQREQNIKNKIEQVDSYKKALDTQVRFKPTLLPPREPDTEVFGKNDTTNETLAERRRRAQQLFQEQRDLVDQRKREVILRRLAEQERDQMILEKTKEGVEEDWAHRHRARVENRRHLEDSWKQAADMKRARDLETRLQGLESGKLLHEQCDQYSHCKQCKRRVNNCGESNIWSESRYVPGSRIMV
ncbi:coiled-coil domain-containing protein 81-like [Babylonia areolata]|uniref:coiled-coil domain-containing protein 81-like n=1 Tax=Babylonia areolata TaxID=304850 RepID=UPI003FD35E3C